MPQDYPEEAEIGLCFWNNWRLGLLKYAIHTFFYYGKKHYTKITILVIFKWFSSVNYMHIVVQCVSRTILSC